MNTNQTQRLPHAAREPLPEPAAFLELFHICFARSEGRHRLERYITGLLSEHPNKNCDTLAQVIPGSSEQSFQGVLTKMVWDVEAVNSARVQRLRRLPTEGDGVLVLDDTGFPKKGTASAGVARQYTGTVTNCQVAVTCVYAERTLSWPVAARRYLSLAWADDAERRARAHVPEDVRFQTKPEIALALIDQARDMGVPYTCITVDSGYGDIPSFLDGMESRDEGYVTAVHRDFGVATHADGRDTQRVDRWVAAQPFHRWRTLSWRDYQNIVMSSQAHSAHPDAVAERSSSLRHSHSVLVDGINGPMKAQFLARGVAESFPKPGRPGQNAPSQSQNRCTNRATAQRTRMRVATFAENFPSHPLARRAWRKDDVGDWRAGWVLAERTAHRQDGKYRYYWSNLHPNTPLIRLADYTHRRHHIEQFHEVSKNSHGMGSVSGTAVERILPAYPTHPDCVQFPGVAGVAPTADPPPGRPPTGRVFPHGGIGDRCRWREHLSSVNRLPPQHTRVNTFMLWGAPVEHGHSLVPSSLFGSSENV